MNLVHEDDGVAAAGTLADLSQLVVQFLRRVDFRTVDQEEVDWNVVRGCVKSKQAPISLRHIREYFFASVADADTGRHGRLIEHLAYSASNQKFYCCCLPSSALPSE